MAGKCVSFRNKIICWPLVFLFLLFLLIGCVRPTAQESNVETTMSQQLDETTGSNLPTDSEQTEENDHLNPETSSTSPETSSDKFFIMHTVVTGDTLGLIAREYGTTTEELIILNQIEDINLIYEGQELRVPGPDYEKLVSPDFHIIPDSELVYGPSAKNFNISETMQTFKGYLNSYEEEVEGNVLDGPQIVQLVAERHSVNPRLLLAILEYQSGWLSQENPAETQFPLGNADEESGGLFKQLNWAANLLNWGYYGRAEGGLNSIFVAEQIPVIFAETLNYGSAGIHLYLAARDNIDYETWLQDVSAEGFYQTYLELFGDPFANEVDPLLPPDLSQPAMELPWSSGETWYFTGGPHGGWNTGSAWAALDFVPFGTLGGCSPTDSWVTAMADGVVTRSGQGAVVTDLDGDGYAGTGWAILYMHLDDSDRAPVGTEVNKGDPIGHPGCVGGFTNGTHLHVARTYNGRWIAADGPLPFEMDGWISEGSGSEYNGLLIRGDEFRTADVLHSEGNAITAD